MALDVEAIWVDIFERLKDRAVGFKTYERRRILTPSPEQCPALFLLDDNGDEAASGDEDGLPPVWSIGGEVWIVDRAQPIDSTSVTSTSLNALIKSVREALERTPTDTLGTGDFYGRGHLQHYTNLGGKLLMLRVTRVEKGPLGENTGQAAAKITIEMEARA